MPSLPVHITANFERNLEDIRLFFEEEEALPAFQALLDLLFQTLIPNLQCFPEMGRDFPTRQAGSEEALAEIEKLRQRAGTAMRLREYICGDYLVLMP